MSSFDIQHQDRAYRLVQRAMSAERLPHAYIFHGPDGVGKETFARGLAAVLLCKHSREVPPSDEPVGRQRETQACRECSDCLTVQAQTHPDLHLIYRQLIKFHDDSAVRRRKGADIGVDVIRQFVIDKVGHKPVQGQAKVFIIRQADRITPQAQNALLKTLEEPPATTFIIMLVSSLDRLLPTTRSRCQLIPFGTLPNDFVAARLTELVPGTSASQAMLMARLAQGSLGVAAQYVQDGLGEFNDRLIKALQNLSKQPVAEVSGRLEQEAKTLGDAHKAEDPEITDTQAQRRGLKTLFSLAAMWYRDVLHTAYESTDMLANAGLTKELAVASATCSPGQAAAAIAQLAEAQSQIDLNVNTKLCLESLIIRLTSLTARR